MSPLSLSFRFSLSSLHVAAVLCEFRVNDYVPLSRGTGVASVARPFSVDCRPMATLFFARQPLGLADRRRRRAAPSFSGPRFSSVSSFVTRAARRRDIAPFHLQPHPLIPLVGGACNSSAGKSMLIDCAPPLRSLFDRARDKTERVN